MQFDPVRRLSCGSIDQGFYRDRAALIRAHSLLAFFKAASVVLLFLLAATGLALALAWLLPSPAGATAMSVPPAVSSQRIATLVLPGSGYVVVFEKPDLEPGSGRPQQHLLRAIAAWLSFEFSLRPIEDLPEVTFASPHQMMQLRFRDAASHGSVAAGREILAVYDDDAETIYLPIGWTGRTPAELSVLVHEMVHHMQNLAGENFDCPEAREKQAYKAQGRWLGLAGSDLNRHFQIDPMTLLVRTSCFH